jgi:hypothetical protein
VVCRTETAFWDRTGCRLTMAGYSETPLAKKLGIKVQSRIALVNEPPSFRETLGELPGGVSFPGDSAKNIDLILFFVKSQFELSKRFTKLASKLAPAGMLWIAWPKKASGVPSDLSDGVVREIGLAAGLVDTKVCAIDDVWSGLKFVIRLKDRPAPKE